MLYVIGRGQRAHLHRIVKCPFRRNGLFYSFFCWQPVYFRKLFTSCMSPRLGPRYFTLLCLAHIVLYGLGALLHVHLSFAQQINCRLKSTPLKYLLRGMVFLSQLSYQQPIKLSIHHLLLRTRMMQTKETMELLSIFVSFSRTIKVVYLLTHAFSKSNEIAKKKQSVNFRVLYDDTKTDLFCRTKDKMPTLNQSVMYMNLCVLDAVLITLGKLGELYWKERLNMLGVTKIVLLISILLNAMVFSICSVLPN